MTLFEILRIAILGIGWPFLIIGSAVILYQEIIFNKKLRERTLGKMLFTIDIGWFLTMYSLGIVCTILMYQNLSLGVKVVLPIFLFWFLSMITLIIIVRRFRKDILRKQDFYNKLSLGIENIVKGNFDFLIKIKEEKDEIDDSTALFNKMIKELKIKEEFLKEEKKRGEEINRMKSEFISIAAHQLRTPLSAVKWVFSMLEDLEETTERQKELFKKGKISTERMIRLANDFLNVSRIEEGKFNYNFETVFLDDIIKTAISEEENRIKEKDINLIFEKPERKTQIKGDAEKLYLVFQNIIENAVNYTLKRGNIKIFFASDENYAKVTVKDDGVGIPKNQLNKLFNKFIRGSNVVRLQTEGSGLGLFIAKNIVEAHKGAVEIKSEENEGTEVIITLPIDF